MRSVYSYFLLLLGFTAFSQANSTALDIARKGTVAEARAIVQNDPKAFNVVSPEGFTPLILACYRNNNEVAAFLIENGADVNATSSMGTALMAAVVKGNSAIAKLLLQKNADPNLMDANGTTALIYAVKFHNPEFVELLLKYKADKDILDKDKKSAFEYATFSGNDAIIQLLK